MLFEVFKDNKQESKVLEILYGLEVSTKAAAKQAFKSVLEEKRSSDYQKTNRTIWNI